MVGRGTLVGFLRFGERRGGEGREYLRKGGGG